MKTLVLLAALAVAPVSPPSSPDDRAVREIVANLESAWNHGDAVAWSRDYSDDAEFINIVGAVYDRRELERRHAMIFQKLFKGSHADFPVRRIRELSPDVKVVETDAVVRGASAMPPGIRVDPDGALRTRFKHILQRRNGRWWIVASQNTQQLPMP